LWGEIGTWSWEAFVQVNVDYFEGELPMKGLVIGMVPQNTWSYSTSCQITLSSDLFDPAAGIWRRGIRPWGGR
jgi:hypothetical protein